MADKTLLPKKGTRHVDVPTAEAYSGTLHRINTILVGDDVLGHLTKRYLSLALLLIASVVGFMTYTKSGFFRTSDVSVRPDMMSGVFAVLLVAPLYIRRIITWSPSVYYILAGVLNVTVTAVLIQAVLGAASSVWLTVPMPFVLGLALAMTWLGIRPLAPVAWAFVIFLGITNLQAASDAMGIWGYLFIICAALGILLQFPFQPQKIFNEVKYDFIGPQDDVTNAERPSTSGSVVDNSKARPDVLDQVREGGVYD